MEQQLCLELDLVEVLLGAFVVLWAAPQPHQDTDDDDYGAEGGAHFVRHVLIAIPHRLQLRFVFLVVPRQRVVLRSEGESFWVLVFC